MGCGSSSKEEQEAQTVHSFTVPPKQPQAPDANGPTILSGKRLSVDYKDPDGDKGSDDKAEACGSIFIGDDIIDMMNTHVIEMMKTASGKKNRVWSHGGPITPVVVGSTTDDNLTENFKDKERDEAGDTSAIDTEMIAYTCRKGLKPYTDMTWRKGSPNQDSYCVMKTANFSIFGVFDGHGIDGHLVSNYVKDVLPRLVIRDESFRRVDQRQELLKKAFVQTHKLVESQSRKKIFKADVSGCTATLVLHDIAIRKLFLAHVGDSTCVLGKWSFLDGEPQGICGQRLTVDHKPNDTYEKIRIEQNGGEVRHDGFFNHRVYAKDMPYPGMAMSRALGDLAAHKECGVIPEPTVTEFELGDDDQLLLVCSDGVWEFIEAQEAVEVVAAQQTIQEGIEALVTLAWDRWIKEEKGTCVDDITAIGVMLQKEMEGSLAGSCNGSIRNSRSTNGSTDLRAGRMGSKGSTSSKGSSGSEGILSPSRSKKKAPYPL